MEMLSTFLIVCLSYEFIAVLSASFRDVYNLSLEIFSYKKCYI